MDLGKRLSQFLENSMRSSPEIIGIFSVLFSLVEKFSELLNGVLKLYLPLAVVLHDPLVHVLVVIENWELGTAQAALFAESVLRRLEESTSGTKGPSINK